MVWHRTWVAISALVLTLLASAHGLTFMATFNAPPPAESPTQPPGGAIASKPGDANAVVIFVVDGLGDSKAELLGDLVDTAPLRCRLRGVYPSFSRPSYVAMLSGAPPVASGVHTNGHRGPAGVDHVIARARAQGVQTQLVTDGLDWWKPLFGPWTREHLASDGFDPALAEALTTVSGADTRRRSLTLIHMVAGDQAGHDHGADSDEYGAAMRAIGEVVERVRDTVIATKSAQLYVIADHGHLARGGHGGPEEEVMNVPLLAWGVGTGSQTACHGRLVDLAPTVAGAMGLAVPASSEGQHIQNLAGDDGTTKGSELNGLREARWGLGVAMGLLVLLLGGLLFKRAQRRWPSAGECLWAASPTVVFALLYAALEPALSFSAVWVQWEWMLRMAVLLAVAFASQRIVLEALWRQPGAPQMAAEGAPLLTLTFALATPVAAAMAHGSWSGGPELGNPHAAFAILVGDALVIGAGLTTLLAIAVDFWRDRRQAAGGA